MAVGIAGVSPRFRFKRQAGEGHLQPEMTQHVVKKNSFSFRSYPDRRDAMAATNSGAGKRSMMVSKYVVDRNDVDAGRVIL